MIVIAVAASSCTVATQESGEPIGDQLSTACDLQDGNSNGQPNPIEREILALVNRERRSAGVEPLCFSQSLAAAARQHNSKMVSQGILDHRIEGEGCLLDRVAFAGLNADEAAENIFSGSQPASDAMAQQCVSMWMRSDGHRRNMLSPDFDKTGISVSYSPRSGSYVTEDFAHVRQVDRRMAMRKGASMRVSHRSRRPPRPTRTTASGVVRVSASSREMRRRETRDPLASMVIVEN